ncbi:MAG: lamin tail domain-containing protein [Kiritimatiellae bacterium]|nr:lamin tail domain-containing protein [Kiritimatiellia bacterium]
MAPISSPHTISTVARRLMFGVALLFGYTALPASAQVTHTVSGPANVSYCDATTITTRFVNTGATLDNLSITQLLPHADFVFVPGSGVITMPGGMVVTNDPSISGQQLVWDFSNVASTSSLSHVVITEAFYTPTNTPKESHEWIELYNPLSASVDMTGWSIRDAMPGQTDLLPPIVINPGEFVIIAASTNAFMAANPGYTGRVFEVTDHTLGSGLNTFADGVFLVNASSVTVDAMSFGGSTAAFNPAAAIAGTGQSNQRSPANQDTNTRNDWTVGSPTPGTGAFQSGINNGGEIVIAYRIEVACGAAAGQIRSFATYQQPAGGTLRTNLSSIFITANPGDLTVTKTPVVQNAGVGDTVVWTVTVKNEGFGNAPNVVIQDNIGSGFQFTSFSVNPTSAPPYGSAVQWDATVIPALTNLAPQQEVTLVVTALMVQCSDLVNTADARWGCRGLEAVPDSICEDTAVNGETAGASIIKIDRYPFLTAALVPPPTIGLDYCDGTEVTLYVTNSATGPDAGAAIDVQYYVFNPSGYQLTGPAVSNGFVQIGTLAPGATTSVTFRIVPGGDCPLDRDEQNIAMYAIYQDPCGNPFMGGPAFTTTRLTDLPWARVTKVMPPSVNPSSTGFPVTVLLEYSNLTAAAVNVYDIYPKHTNLAVANISAGGSLNVGEGRVEWNPTLTGDGVFTGRFDMVFLNPCNGPYGLLENVVIATNLVDCHTCPVDVVGSGRSYFTDAARVYCGGPGTGGCSFAATKFGTPGLVEECEPVLLTHRFASFSGSSTPTNWNGVQFTSSLANAQGYLTSTSSVSVSIDGNDVTPFVTIAQSSPTLVLDLSGLNASAYSGPHLVTTNLSISWDVSTTNTGSFVDRSALFMQPCGVEEDYYQWEVGRSELIISLAKTDFAEACGTVEGRIDLTQLASPELATTNRIFPSYDVDVVLDLDLLNAGGDGYSYVAGSAVFADFFDLAGNPIASFEPTISGHTLTWSLGDLRTNGVGSITYRLLVPCDLDPNVKQQARVLFNGRCDDDTVPQLRSSLSSTNDAPFVFQANLSYQIKPETLYLQDNLLVYTLEFLNSGNGTAFNVEPEFFFPHGRDVFGCEHCAAFGVGHECRLGAA